MFKVSGGQSEKDRIMFYNSKNTATAIRNKDGEITLEYIKDEESDLSLKDIAILAMFFTIPIIMKIILICLIENTLISAICYLLPTFFYFLITILVIRLLRKKEGEEFLRNHGAEHMVINAFTKLKRIPSIDEVYSFSRISRKCGVTFFSSMITTELISFIVFICITPIISESLSLLIAQHLSIVIAAIFHGSKFDYLGKIFQLYTTSKPKPSNIELAISALSALEQKEFFDDIN